MHDYLDIYCERTAPGLWGEPLNTLSNLAFLLAAALLLRDYRMLYHGRMVRGWDRLLLILLLAAIGVGSGLWHLYAQRWAMLADVLPIAAFISVYLLVFLIRIAGLGGIATVAWFLLYHLANRAIQTALPADFLNGSVFYLPTWISLALMASYLAYRGLPQWRLQAGASLLFLVSLAWRTADLALCPAWPWGTHFIWHLLNALLLYLLVRALLPTRPFSRERI